MSSAETEMEHLTSGASNRIIPLLKALRASLIFVYTFFLSFLFFILPRRRRLSSAAGPPSPKKHLRQRWLVREEEDTFRRRALAQDYLGMGRDEGSYRWSTSIFYGVRNKALFCRSWFPVSEDVKGILIIIHGLNEHSGRYAEFARQLTSCNFAVYAMDWIGHGGSDGLHGYVPSLDHVVADTGAFLEKIRSENPGIPCFLFGHSTGGAVVLKAASHPHIEVMVEGIILTSPALRVKPAHPIVGAVHPQPSSLCRPLHSPPSQISPPSNTLSHQLLLREPAELRHCVGSHREQASSSRAPPRFASRRRAPLCPSPLRRPSSCAILHIRWPSSHHHQRNPRICLVSGCKYRVVGATSQMPYTEKAKHFLGYVLQPIAICVCLW